MTEKKREVTVEVIDGGPIKITGRIVLKDLKRDTEETPGEIYLCRCGRSKTKPFCDDSHNK
ncbi:MAG TPA: CDGSH iron-sulfur domain-containing protein [Bacteroidales bacterium]|jgi:CDGSH-type Zn-finger protein|nr:CDGSH iron-sulfur domain-containing protein [Bacteroidales bacterium]